MSGLDDIQYSRDETISAVRRYYTFLAKVYLNESEIVEPPAGGWPHIDNLRSMGKTDEVYDLLRHLPYLRETSIETPQAAPSCHFANWREIAQYASLSPASGGDGHGHRLCSEPPELIDRIPPCVVGLTYGGRENPCFLLDNMRDIVHWYECKGTIRHNLNNDTTNWVAPVTDMDDPFDWDIPEGEAEWRLECPAWSVPDFFNILRGQFHDLKFVPVSSRVVREVYAGGWGNSPVVLSAVQNIYRRHGWPDLATFRKQECLRAVRRTLREEFPDFLIRDFGEEDGEEDEQ
ncbi:hypothetical protein PG993_004263 [Apiospora rasikravindrae]|uniref:Uncharacterized protein n=1 Tax=Apiospora rasikravindrae TaxID=990691 RepID=A0ABR1TEN7_9PEZI